MRTALRCADAAALAAKNATRSIPIVFIAGGDPVGLGLVSSLGRPGRNMTCVSILVSELDAKRLALLKDLVPKVTFVAVLLNPLNPNSGPSLRRVEAVARSLGISLRALEARSPTELDTVFSAMTTERADAVLVLADAMFLFQRKQIVELAARYRLPTVYQLREFPEIGGLMSYGTGLSDTYRRVAAFVDKILKGAKPGDLPVEQPTKFELIINLKTAKALGLSIPQSLLLRADQLIE